MPFEYKIPDKNHLTPAQKEQISAQVNQAIAELDTLFGNEPTTRDFLGWFVRWKATATFTHLGKGMTQYFEETAKEQALPDSSKGKK